MKNILIAACAFAAMLQPAFSSAETENSISSNPGAVTAYTGTGSLGTALGFGKDSAFRLGGLWIGDMNYLTTGGERPRSWSGNNLFQLALNVDTQKLGGCGYKGGLFGTEFLRFDGSHTNERAGVVQGYNSLQGASPLHRSELYQLWYRQELFDKKLIMRIGKMIPSRDFTNVTRPVPYEDKPHQIPVTSGLIYTPLYVNSSLLGVLPGYYNSACGITTTFAPIKSAYLSYGLYDGNLARGRQTGLYGPRFNGYSFQIIENGYTWTLDKKPGHAAVGAWWQSGKLKAINNETLKPIQEKGIGGIYMFGSQRLWYRHPGVDNSGLEGFVQFGVNDSKTLRMKKFVGVGLTAFGLVPTRPEDSFGVGLAWAKINSKPLLPNQKPILKESIPNPLQPSIIEFTPVINKRILPRRHEVLLQTYYQMPIFQNAFFQTTVTYVPHPAVQRNLKHAWVASARIIFLF